jgi:hypothetical protein
MRLSDLLRRYAKQFPQLREEQQPAAPPPSAERKGIISHQTSDHTGPTIVASGESTQQCSLLREVPFQLDRSPSVPVKAQSDVLQAPVWGVRDDLPQVEWPQDGPVYTHREVRILTKVGQDVLPWVNTVEIFNAKVIAAYSAAKQSPSSRRHQHNVDV